MKIVPITLKQANQFVVKNHRHHREVVGCKFSIGLMTNELIGVAICGRPVSRKLDNGLTLEVNRLCVLDGVKNGCSMLYGACARIAKDMGFEKIITYILKSETGVSLKASGWKLDCQFAGGKEWNSSKNMIRQSETIDLFGTHLKYPSEMKKRYIKILSAEGRPKQ